MIRNFENKDAALKAALIEYRNFDKQVQARQDRNELEEKLRILTELSKMDYDLRMKLACDIQFLNEYLHECCKIQQTLQS